MKYIKGFRFHPTDAEAMELLWDKVVLDRDSTVQVGDVLVQVITQLKDICEFESWELPERSELESGDNLWYFFYSPRYKYRNSKRQNRVTKKGYWKPTGKPCDIVVMYDGKEISGSRQTLVFYLGRVGDGNKSENKTLHEFKLNLPKQELLTESEALTEYSGFQSQITTTEQEEYEFVGSFLVNSDEFYSNQPHLDDKNNDVSKNQEGLCLINQKPKAATDQTYSKEGSSLFAENESSSLAFESHVAVDSFPMLSPEYPEFDEFLWNGIFMAELIAVPEAPKNCDGLQNHEFSTNEQNDSRGITQ